MRFAHPFFVNLSRIYNPTAKIIPPKTITKNDICSEATRGTSFALSPASKWRHETKPAITPERPISVRNVPKRFNICGLVRSSFFPFRNLHDLRWHLKTLVGPARKIELGVHLMRLRHSIYIHPALGSIPSALTSIMPSFALRR